jgi:molybdopterin-guanine dinucleotide biosynthesis protein
MMPSNIPCKIKNKKKKDVSVSMQYGTQSLNEQLSRIKLQMAKYGKVDSVYIEGFWHNWLSCPTVVLIKKSEEFMPVSKSVV